MVIIDKEKCIGCMLLGHPDVAYPRTAPRAKADVVML